MGMDSRSADDREDPTSMPPVEAGEQLVTSGCKVLGLENQQSSPPTGAARRVVCTRVRGQRPLAFLDEDQTVVGAIPESPQPGRALQVYSAQGVCVLQSSRIRMLMHGPDGTIVVTRNSTYRVTYVDDD